MQNLSRFQHWWMHLFVAIFLTGCGGSDTTPVGQPDPEVFPHAISYKTLTGQADGNVLQLTISENFGFKCDGPFVNPCLASFSPLLTKEGFQSYVAQSPAAGFNKPNVLAAGNAVDFAQEQIWAFKFSATLSGLTLKLNIKETALQIEVRAVVCNSLNVDAPSPRYDVFAIVPRNVATKPVVILDNLPCGS